MKCPRCNSTKISKNGRHRVKQRYKFKRCNRQFLEFYTTPGYDRQTKEQCLKMYVNGMGFRAIERVTGVHHTTIINWVKQIVERLDDTPTSEEIPEIFQIDELQTYISKKKIRFGFGLR